MKTKLARIPVEQVEDLSGILRGLAWLLVLLSLLQFAINSSMEILSGGGPDHISRSDPVYLLEWMYYAYIVWLKPVIVLATCFLLTILFHALAEILYLYANIRENVRRSEINRQESNYI